jgi:hypothetical protein
MIQIIQSFPDELDYVNAKLHPLAPTCGSFCDAFLRACLSADWEWYPKLQPILREMMEKWPPDPRRLEIEKEDSGNDD